MPRLLKIEEFNCRLEKQELFIQRLETGLRELKQFFYATIRKICKEI